MILILNFWDMYTDKGGKGKFFDFEALLFGWNHSFFNFETLKNSNKSKTNSGNLCHVRIFMDRAIIFATDLRNHFLRSLTGKTDEQWIVLHLPSKEMTFIA